MPMSLTRDLKRSKEGMEGYEIGQEREREKNRSEFLWNVVGGFEMASIHMKSEEKSAWRTTFICRHCSKGRTSLHIKIMSKNKKASVSVTCCDFLMAFLFSFRNLTIWRGFGVAITSKTRMLKQCWRWCYQSLCITILQRKCQQGKSGTWGRGLYRLRQHRDRWVM